MAWQDRLRTFRYTSPSGQSFTLKFFDLSRSGGKKAPESEFPGQDEGAVQDLGERIVRFPVTVYLVGENYDLDADRFWNALSETGYGTLEHPRWGNLTVIPTTREQSENFVDGAGRATFSVTFLRVTSTVFEYPRASTAPDDAVQAAAETAAGELSDQVEDADLTNVREKSALTDNVTDGVDKIGDGFRTLTNASADLNESVKEAIGDITRNIDTLILTPAELMTELLRLYRLPARVAIDVQAKIDGYRSVYTSLIGGFRTTTRNYGTTSGLFGTSQLGAIGIAAAESVSVGPIPTRAQASVIIERLASLRDDINASIEELETLGDFAMDYNARQEVAVAIATAILNLINKSISLPTERVIVLDRNVPPLVLLYELDGDIERLDTFLEYNELKGNELLEIPTGREVRWYAA